ncbi:transposase [Patescibacteria group bacterium AH-259-L07]|nr:transposase [Patescibacteria group bacterium AH-259-L07]
MLKIKPQQQSFYGDFLYDRVIPKDHLLKKIDKIIDFSFVNDVVKDCYCPDFGRPAIEPVKLFKIAFLEYLYNISDVRIMKEVQVNMAYKWFVGYQADERVPDDSTLVVFRKRLGEKKFKQLFDSIVAKAKAYGLVTGDHQMVDATDIQASVATPQLTKEEKKKPNDPPPSPLDPDAQFGAKSDKRKFFGYKKHTLMDKSEIITGVTITAGGVTDDEPLKELIQEQQNTHAITPRKLSGDSIYGTGENRRYLNHENIQAIIPVGETTGPKPKPNQLKREAFTFDSETHTVTCPNKQTTSKFSVPKHAQGKSFYFSVKQCRNCPLMTQCLSGKAKYKTIFISEYYHEQQEAKAYQTTEEYQDLRQARGIIEHKQAEEKRFHGLERARCRGRPKLAIQAYLTSLVVNVKRMVTLRNMSPPELAVVLNRF